MSEQANSSAAIVLASLLIATPLSAKAVEVATTKGLLAALSRATPGGRILLAPGSYENVVIRGFNGSATIASADPARPAVLKDLTVDSSSGLVLEDLEMSAAEVPMDAAGFGKMVFRVLHSRDIVLRRLNVHGSPTGTLATDVSGVLVRWSNHVTVEGSEFSHLHNGLQHADTEYLTVRHNHFHFLRDDGIRGGGSSYILIEGNVCDSMHPDREDTDHPDCIQFWTRNTTAAAHDITIRDNRYYRGSGNPTQGIFLRDENTTMPYRNLVISENVTEGASWNGITVMGADKPIIQDNRVCAYADQASWLVVRDTVGATVRHNQAPLIHYVNAPQATDTHNSVKNRCETTRGSLPPSDRP